VASERRIEKINTLLREVIAGILARELQPAADVMVTVTRVAASPDLHYATVFVSALGAADERAVLADLSRAAGTIQRGLNRAVRMRPVPKITFAIDEQEKRRERIERILSDSEGKG
jgi:ribosome-binding factor A